MRVLELEHNFGCTSDDYSFDYNSALGFNNKSVLVKVLDSFLEHIVHYTFEVIGHIEYTMVEATQNIE